MVRIILEQLQARETSEDGLSKAAVRTGYLRILKEEIKNYKSFSFSLTFSVSLAFTSAPTATKCFTTST